MRVKGLVVAARLLSTDSQSRVQKVSTTLKRVIVQCSLEDLARTWYILVELWFIPNDYMSIRTKLGTSVGRNPVSTPARVQT